MRWKDKLPPIHGQRRIKKVWLVRRRCIGGECRWLESAVIVQEFVVETAPWAKSRGWEDRAWVDTP